MTSRLIMTKGVIIGFEEMTVSLNSYPTINLCATGERIRRLRMEAGLSVRDLSRLLFLSDVQAVYKWQRGENLPSVENLVLLSWLLVVPIDKILVVEYHND